MAMIGAVLFLLVQGDPKASDVFQKRILPIFKSPNPSSCVECHLAGVDLKNYIHPSHEKTFLSLRDQGLVDLANPEGSKILKLISMGESDGAKLLTAKARKAEYEAFLEWIKVSAADPALRDAPKLAAAELAKPKRPDEVIRHARKDRLLDSFEKNVWSQRFRCSGCHSPAGAENAKLVKENGPEMTWIKGNDVEASLAGLLESRVVNPKTPEQSLLLTKPTNQVKHGGGQKMIVGDMAYKGFRVFLEDYAKTVGDKYAKASDLPKEAAALEQFGSDIWIKLENTPPAWGNKLLQVSLYAWDAPSKGFEKDPIAWSDRKVFAQGKLWQHNLNLLALPDSPRAKEWSGGRASLPSGRYLVRVHVDVQGRLERDWKSAFGKADLMGEWEVESRWPAGYGAMTAIDVSGRKR